MVLSERLVKGVRTPEVFFKILYWCVFFSGCFRWLYASSGERENMLRELCCLLEVSKTVDLFFFFFFFWGGGGGSIYIEN